MSTQSMTQLGSGSVGTPAGEVRFAVNGAGALVALGFADRWDGLLRELARRFGPVTFAPTQGAAVVAATLERYLAGELAALEGLPVDLGGTPFQRRVWDALRAIPVGSTVSYAQIADTIGAPRAARAVGAANGRNPVSIVVPCHRVVASSGALHGYGGGLDRKRWLLEHECRPIG